MMTMAWSDGWILLAVIYAGGGEAASLEAVVAAADYINHAILTVEEMQGALARLTAKGYIIFAEEQISPSEQTMAYYRSIAGPRRKVFDELDDILAFIRTTEPESDAAPKQATVESPGPGISREAFDAAVERYLARHPGPKRRH